MSRSGYSEDCMFDNWEWIMWRGAVKAAFRGKRGQSFLRELIAALDALPEKSIVRNDLQKEGNYCALGAVGKSRGIDMSKMDPYDTETISGTFGIADAMAREIMFMNDEAIFDIMGDNEQANVKRFVFMREWAEKNLMSKAQ